MNKDILKINWASHEAAEYACKHWHYSKCMPVGKIVKIGVWENDAFKGVVLFSRGANNSLLKPYGLEQDAGCELTRIALKKHITPVSRIMKIAFIFIKKACPKLRLIVSFADSKQNHHGGIYQATNWVYVGRTGMQHEYYFKGVWMHRRSASSLRGSIVGLVKRKNGFRHRYLMPLDNEMRKQIEHLRKPYPKCVQSIGNDAPDDQSGEGGATPTCTLHLYKTQVKEAKNEKKS